MGIPVHLITGPLGAGKTTTLTHLLHACPKTERIVVIVNDFGEAAIDAAAMEASDLAVQVTAIQGVCVCCTAPQNFSPLLAKLLEQEPPDRIFVEPTGLARPSDLIDTLRRGPHADRLELRPTLLVVDPHRLSATPADASVLDQAAAADVIVANRSDLCAEEDHAALDAWIATLWPAPARVIRTSFGQVSADVLLPIDRQPAPVRFRAIESHSPSAVARSAVWPWTTLFSRAKLVAVVAALAEVNGVLRLKGLFRTDEGVLLLDIAGGRVHEHPSGYRRDSRVDVITTDSFMADDAVLRLSDSFADPAVRGSEVEVVFPSGERRAFSREALAALPDGVPDVGALIPKRQGTAVRLRSMLDCAGVGNEGDLVFIAADGLVSPAVSVASVAHGLLVYSLEQGPLPEDLGGPLRLLIPGDGPACANVKGLVTVVWRPGVLDRPASSANLHDAA